MGNIAANIGLGRGVELADTDPTGWVFLLLQATGLEADDILRDYATVADMLAATNTEANFTNYARIVTPASDATVSVDDTNNRGVIDFPDLTWVDAGGVADNTLGKLVCCYVRGAGDANLQPFYLPDFAATTDGTNLVAQVNDLLYASSLV